MRGLTVMCALLIGFGGAQAQPVPLAVTIDDLPAVGPVPKGGTAESAVTRIIATLSAAKVPATGFFTCDRIASAPTGLKRWMAAGLAVANHSQAHRSADEHTIESWRADTVACQGTLEAAGAAPEYYRFPYLQTGKTVEKRDAIFATLATLKLKRAPVSIDTADWAFAEPYVAALDAGDAAKAAAIADAYVTHLRLAARHYRRVARQVAGREVAQVLLLHANAITADHLDRALKMLQAEGFRFAPLDEVLADAVYGQPDKWVDPVGASWLYRLTPDPAAWAWDQGQQRAIETRFGDRPDGPVRIGKDLVARPVEGVTGWVIEDKTPISANALLYLTPGGTPILADTPWTPNATRELLDWVELRFGRLPALATISHYHLDASGGIGPLREAGVRVVASTDTAARLKARGEAMRASLEAEHGAMFAGWTVAEPSETFDPAKGFEADVDGTPVRALFFGGGHAHDNVVTWFPAAKLAFGGCLVKGGDSLGYLGDANLETYPAAIRGVMGLKPKVLVVGHGPSTSPAQLENTLRLLEAHGGDAE